MEAHDAELEELVIAEVEGHALEELDLVVDGFQRPGETLTS